MKKLLAILCGIASVFGALFFGMKRWGASPKAVCGWNWMRTARNRSGRIRPSRAQRRQYLAPAGREWAEHMRLDKYLKVSRLIKRRTGGQRGL